MKAEICQKTESCNIKVNPLQLFTRHYYSYTICVIAKINLRFTTDGNGGKSLTDNATRCNRSGGSGSTNGGEGGCRSGDGKDGNRELHGYSLVGGVGRKMTEIV